MTIDDKMKILLSYRADYTLVYSPPYNVSTPYSMRHTEQGIPICQGRTANEAVTELYDTMYSLMYTIINNSEED
jgi:hypothetical protein